MKLLRFAMLVLLALGSGTALAAEIRVLSAGAVEPGLVKLAEQFQRDTGNKVKIQFGTAPELARRLVAGEAADVLIAPPGVVNEQVRNGKVDADSRITVGRIGVGVAVRFDAPDPDIATLDAFKRSLLSTDSVVYNRASTGLYLERLFELMGIDEQLKAKTTRYASGAQVLEHVIQGKGNEIGFGAITEIKLFEQKGLKLVGPLPAQVQNQTPYAAGVMTDARSADEAANFIRFLGTPAAKAIFSATGVD
ncbi:MAG: substrate-binding domain-containing protein [Burkholderiales bacterium]